MVGSAILQRLAAEDCDIIVADKRDLDLRDQNAVRGWMDQEQPDCVIIAAAKVGGILANSTLPADFLFDNLAIATNVIDAAHRADVDRLLFLGSSCIYPKFADQPIQEEALLSGPLEPTNEWYAIAKIAGIKLAQSYRIQHGRDYISAMPTNLYGPGDNFDLSTSHVLPALIAKAHAAKVNGDPELVVWGSGLPMREFLFSHDCADACVFLLKHYSGDMPLNLGYGSDISIHSLAEMVCQTVDYGGKIVYDLAKPDGTPKKLMSSERLNNLGWKPTTSLELGIKTTYDWYLKNCT